jgi:peptidoglycan hydrolase CwlO-like protein
MKIWNKNICLTSPMSIIIIATLFFSTIVLANVWTEEEIVVEEITEEEKKMWIPTKEDIAYQDSMFSIIQNTQNDVTDIKEDIVHILERLDYADGTHDSIRYVKGGKIDKKRNQ